MRFILLTALCCTATSWAQSSAATSFLAKESPIAKAGVLANIGPSGSKVAGAASGIIIAGPSKSNPDYFYTWTRDSALVIKALIEQYTRGEDPSLRTVIDRFVASQIIQQKVSNPSGTISSGGLGEPKFNADLSAFTGGWGRPQRDGPALRATSLIAYGNWLMENSNTTYALSTIWPIVKLDLDYTASTWNQTGFDLWEEVNSSSFFTTAVQHRALREGATFATKLGQTSAVSGYLTQAGNALCFLQSYWNPGAGYVTSNTGGGRSGKDANSALASLHTFDPSAGCDSVTFQPCSDKALSSLKVYVDSFRSIYALNSGVPFPNAIATGRYPEDTYYGGNPWYLTTLAVSEQLYDALKVWKSQGSLNVTAISLAFFQQFDSTISVGTYPSTSAKFTALTTAVNNWADSFVEVVQKYTPANGALAEQYTRAAGVPTSAPDLTWSYASVLTTIAARNGLSGDNWGAKGLTVPATCSTSGGGSGGGSVGTVPVTFNVAATTVWGESIYLTGSVDSLANWSPNNALLLSAANYPTWSITVNLPQNSAVQYKYIRKNNGAVTWLADPNNQVNTGTSAINLSDKWR